MPEHPLRARVKRAKRQGIAVVMKDTDWGGGVDISRHSAKKASHVAGLAGLADRNVRPRSRPGEGAARRRAKTADQARAAYRAENAASGGGRGRLYGPIEGHPHPVTRVQGRKKAPSQMNIKRRGGPRRRTPLHGG